MSIAREITEQIGAYSKEYMRQPTHLYCLPEVFERIVLENPYMVDKILGLKIILTPEIPPNANHGTGGKMFVTA